MKDVIQEYLKCSRFQDEDISGGDYVSGNEDSADDRQPPKKDTLFAWFFRGELPAEAKSLFDRGKNSLIAPEAMRKGLVDKNQSVSILLEINWANLLSQIMNPALLSLKRCAELLQTHTLYCALNQLDLLDELFPRVMPLLKKLIDGEDVDREQFQTLDIHNALLSLCLRTGHGLVDLYLARIRRGSGDLSSDSRADWMDDLASVLSRQSSETGFNTYWECQQLAQHLDLIIKTNFPDIYDKSADQYRLYLARALNPVAPIMGATGDTSSTRSAQARKFRMPGYPLALISTEVFQEGEDLHTFCDSVMHYGLSGSPVSIEQKIGRVDRVGSHAMALAVCLSSLLMPWTKEQGAVLAQTVMDGDYRLRLF